MFKVSPASIWNFTYFTKLLNGAWTTFNWRVLNLFRRLKISVHSWIKCQNAKFLSMLNIEGTSCVWISQNQLVEFSLSKKSRSQFDPFHPSDWGRAKGDCEPLHITQKIIQIFKVIVLRRSIQKLILIMRKTLAS